jgi:hypothetical protein
MYRAPAEPSSHIGVMQLRKNGPKNGTKPRPIESPNGTEGRNGTKLPHGTVRLMLPPAQSVTVQLPHGTVRLMLPHYLSVTAHGPYLLEGL